MLQKPIGFLTQVHSNSYTSKATAQSVVIHKSQIRQNKEDGGCTNLGTILSELIVLSHLSVVR